MEELLQMWFDDLCPEFVTGSREMKAVVHKKYRIRLAVRAKHWGCNIYIGKSCVSITRDPDQFICGNYAVI